MTPEHTFVIHRLYDRFNQDQKQVFFVTGPDPKVGVTYCCLNIAAAAVELMANYSILLIDMNVYHPSLSESAKNPEKGWVPWLTENKAFPLKEAIFPWAESDHLNFLPTGHIKNYRHVAAQMPHWSDMFDILKKDFNLIIVDLPAFYQGTEARILSRAADDIMIVIEADATRRPIVSQMVDELRSMNTSILGVLFNKRKFHIPRWIHRRFF
ncbi:tyrosine-protein kinase family protein [Desulfonema magnum]|uniref:Cellulose biosynthesis protein domain-containing protein n=1 Tax=Desulfonema magnum TaxID=45655 RepID=A0A975BUS3_9BACT|nr:cellulose synthase operon protein YhjQ/BcsQ [Desulfonema magnum]QTA91877.1 Cellulose biosynthesis protein domain-containing protein [Desulfonema magnum]